MAKNPGASGHARASDADWRRLSVTGNPPGRYGTRVGAVRHGALRKPFKPKSVYIKRKGKVPHPVFLSAGAQ